MKKPFTCVYCQKKFNDLRNMKEYEKKNIMEKPFSCGYCEKKFNHSRNMKEHEKNKHNGKPFIYMWIL